MNLEYPTMNRALEKLPTEIAEIEAASRIVYYSDPRSVSADRFRVLRMRLREFQAAEKAKSILVTSPLPHDGKSTIVLNLATALAEHGKKTVLVIEGDLHRPTLTKQLGLNSGPGFGECLATHMDPMSVIRRVEPLGWYLLPAGSVSQNPSDLLETESLPKLIHNLASSFDWVVIDSPPVLPLTDTLLLAKSADTTLLVARAGQTPRRLVDEAIERIGKRRIQGMILNGIDELKSYYSGYGYY